MKKLLIAIISILLVSAFACSGTAKDINIDVNAAAQELIDNCQFDETPALTPAEHSVKNLLRIDPALVATDESGAYLCAMGVCASTPEIVIVIEAVSEEAANTINDEQIADKIYSYLHDYSNYTPTEIDKIETCVNKVVGKYVFLIISADNAAAEDVLDGIIEQ